MFSKAPVQQADARKLLELSSRQKEVLVALLTGASNKEIAVSLGVSEQCVKQHLTHLFRRFDVDGRVALALAVERALMAVEPRPADSLGVRVAVWGANHSAR